MTNLHRKCQTCKMEMAINSSFTVGQENQPQIAFYCITPKCPQYRIQMFADLNLTKEELTDADRNAEADYHRNTR